MPWPGPWCPSFFAVQLMYTLPYLSSNKWNPHVVKLNMYSMIINLNVSSFARIGPQKQAFGGFGPKTRTPEYFAFIGSSGSWSIIHTAK